MIGKEAPGSRGSEAYGPLIEIVVIVFNFGSVSTCIDANVSSTSRAECAIEI